MEPSLGLWASSCTLSSLAVLGLWSHKKWDVYRYGKYFPSYPGEDLSQAYSCLSSAKTEGFYRAGLVRLYPSLNCEIGGESVASTGASSPCPQQLRETCRAVGSQGHRDTPLQN